MAATTIVYKSGGVTTTITGMRLFGCDAALDGHRRRQRRLEPNQRWNAAANATAPTSCAAK